MKVLPSVLFSLLKLFKSFLMVVKKNKSRKLIHKISIQRYQQKPVWSSGSRVIKRITFRHNSKNLRSYRFRNFFSFSFPSSANFFLQILTYSLNNFCIELKMPTLFQQLNAKNRMKKFRSKNFAKNITL